MRKLLLPIALWMGFWVISSIGMIMIPSLSFGIPYRVNANQMGFYGDSAIEVNLLVLSDKLGFCHIDQIQPPSRECSYPRYCCSGLTDRRIAILRHCVTFFYFVCIYLVTFFAFLICRVVAAVFRCRVEGGDGSRHYISRHPVLSMLAILLILLSGTVLYQNDKGYSIFSFTHLYVIRHKEYDWKCHASYKIMDAVCSHMTHNYSDTTGSSNQIKQRPFEALGYEEQEAYLGILVGLDTMPLGIACFLHYWFVFNRSQRRRKGYCICGYDLKGNTSGTCPECGITVQVD